MIVCDYLAAGFPVLFVQTVDETQTVKTIHAEAVAAGRAVSTYSAAGLFVDAAGNATRATFVPIVPIGRGSGKRGLYCCLISNRWRPTPHFPGRCCWLLTR